MMVGIMASQEIPPVAYNNVSKVVFNAHKVLHQILVKKNIFKSVRLFCYFPCNIWLKLSLVKRFLKII